MNTMSWLNHPALQMMDEKKRTILMELIKESEGKPLTQSLPVLMNAQNKLKEQGLSFTKEETALIMAILTKDLSPAEKSKVEAMKKMMSK